MIIELTRDEALVLFEWLTSSDLPLTFEGTVTVGGTAASPGILGLSHNSLRGTLGGRLVG